MSLCTAEAQAPQRTGPLKQDGQQAGASLGDTRTPRPGPDAGPSRATVHRIHFLETHPFPMTKEKTPDSQIHKTIQAAMSPLLFLAHDHCVSIYKGWKV